MCSFNEGGKEGNVRGAFYNNLESTGNVYIHPSWETLSHWSHVCHSCIRLVESSFDIGVLHISPFLKKRCIFQYATCVTGF